MKLDQLKGEIAIVGMILCLLFAPLGKAAFAAEPSKAQPTVAKEAKERKKVTPDFTKKKTAKKPAKKATKAK
jgi:hypothetical protein